MRFLKSDSWMAPFLVFWAVVIPVDILFDVAVYELVGPGIGRERVREVLLWWASWVALTPVLAGFGRRVRPQRIGWARSIPVVAVAGFPLIFAHAAIAVTLFKLTESVPTLPWWPYLWQLLDNVFVATFAVYFGSVTVFIAYHDLRETAEAREQAAEASAALGRLEADLSRTRLATLTAEARPEFVRRALATIGSRIEARRGEEAVQLIAWVGDLLRTFLADDDDLDVPLADAVDLVRVLFRVEAAALGDALTYRIDLGQDIGRVRVPPGLLLTIVEPALASVADGAGDPVALDLRIHALYGRVRIVAEHTGTGAALGVDRRQHGRRLAAACRGRGRVLAHAVEGGAGRVVVELESFQRDDHGSGPPLVRR